MAAATSDIPNVVDWGDARRLSLSAVPKCTPPAESELEPVARSLCLGFVWEGDVVIKTRGVVNKRGAWAVVVLAWGSILSWGSTSSVEGMTISAEVLAAKSSYCNSDSSSGVNSALLEPLLVGAVSSVSVPWEL